MVTKHAKPSVDAGDQRFRSELLNCSCVPRPVRQATLGQATSFRHTQESPQRPLCQMEHGRVDVKRPSSPSAWFSEPWLFSPGETWWKTGGHPHSQSRTSLIPRLKFTTVCPLSLGPRSSGPRHQGSPHRSHQTLSLRKPRCTVRAAPLRGMPVLLPPLPQANALRLQDPHKCHSLDVTSPSALCSPWPLVPLFKGTGCHLLDA